MQLHNFCIIATYYPWAFLSQFSQNGVLLVAFSQVLRYSAQFFFAAAHNCS